ncbi:MAG: DUF1844 domain-containing protein [Acidobacteria bacterium]|nr:DUF1844 domain-containing protein [Acidobacteriota bacterium]
MADDTTSSFKIRDRRLFNPDGSVRESAEETDRDTEPVILTPERKAEPAEPVTEAGRNETGELPVFLEFLSSLVFSAQASLGLIKHPELQGRPVDLEGGRRLIDILGAIQEKTRGNLTPEESRLLQLALDELRLSFVKLSKKK